MDTSTVLINAAVYPSALILSPTYLLSPYNDSYFKSIISALNGKVSSTNFVRGWL